VRPLAAEERAKVVEFIDGLAKPLGRRYIAMALRGSRARALGKKRVAGNPQFGALRGVHEDAIYRALDELLAEGVLAPKGKKYPTLWIAGKPVRPRSGVDEREGAQRAHASAGAGRRTGGLEAALRRFRRKEARRRRIKPYQVFQDKTLRALCAERPTDLNALREVWGIGSERAHKYGDALLALCAHS